MADLAYRRDVRPRLITDWGAIWAGIFAYYAIWLVFGTLGLACFGSAGYVGVWGYGTWAIVLNVIAFFIAGVTTGRNAAVAPTQGVRHGLTMFGLANAGEIILIAIGYAVGRALSAGTAQVQNGFNYAGYLWPVWIALFLGMIGALAGAHVGVNRRERAEVRTETEEPISIRPAA